jgi:AcrR family transcriptional regulator
VVQSAGVSKPTVYSHFPSKQALWQAMLEQAIAASEAQRATLDHTGIFSRAIHG